MTDVIRRNDNVMTEKLDRETATKYFCCCNISVFGNVSFTH